jgi:hypothetical protein
MDEVVAWFAERLPDDWFSEPASLRVDREEILVVGPLRVPMDDPVEHRRAIQAFRDATRDERMRIADEAEVRWERKVSWGIHCGHGEVTFTTLTVPVMTRLRMDERAVLDTLIDAGVARSRSEAIAWCVRLVGQHEQHWIDDLRDALAGVEEARSAGPSA